MARPGRGRPNKPIIVTGSPPAVPAQPTHTARVVLADKTRRVLTSGRAFLTHGANPLGNPAAATPAVHAAKVVAVAARRGTGRILLAHGVMAAAVVAPVQPHPIVHSTAARRAGVVQVHRAPSLAERSPQPHVSAVSSRRVGRVILWRAPGAVGVAAQPTPLHPAQVHTTTARRSGRAIVGRPQAPVTPSKAPTPIVRTGTARRPGVTQVHVGRPGLFLTTPHPVVRSTSTRRNGVVRIVTGHPGKFAGGPPAQVHTTSTRRAGRIVVVHDGAPFVPPFTVGALTAATVATATLTATAATAALTTATAATAALTATDRRTGGPN